MFHPLVWTGPSLTLPARVSPLVVREESTRSIWRRLPNLLTVMILVLIAANYFGTFADLDFAWQIRTGEQIILQGTLRPVDAFTFTIAGEHVPDFEWLYELLLYGIWNVFGFGGLKLLRVVLVAVPLLLVAHRLRREGVRWHGIGLSLVFAILLLAPAWNLRPMYFTTIGLLLVSGWLHDHCTGRKPLPFWLVPVMLLWSNLHPGVIIGQALLLGAIAWEWLNCRLRWNPPLDGPALKRLTWIGGAGFLVSFIGPDPIERLLYPFKPELAHPIMRIFVEMQPLYVFVSKPPFTIGLVFGPAALVLLTVVLRFRHYRLWELALLAGLAGLANLAVRSLQDWVLLMLAVGVPHLGILLARATRRNRCRPFVTGLLRADRFCKRMGHSAWLRWQPAWVLAAVAALAVVSLIPPIARRMPWQNAAEWPVAAVDHIDKQGLAGRFFAPPDYGAYLTWRLGTRVQVYTDTRGFFFPPHLLEDSIVLPQLADDWRKRLDRVLNQYQADFFLLETTGGRGQLWRHLQTAIEQPLFVNEQSVLLSARQVREGLRKQNSKTKIANCQMPNAKCQLKIANRIWQLVIGNWQLAIS